MHQCRSGGSGGASVERWRACRGAPVEMWRAWVHQWRGGEHGCISGEVESMQGCISAANQYMNSAHGPTYPLTLSGWGGSQKNRSLPSISS